jgi:hypothetical protein
VNITTTRFPAHLQANRGLLVKGKVSTEGVSAAMAVKAW